MTSGPLHLHFDTTGLSEKLERLRSALSSLPDGVADGLREGFLASLDGLRLEFAEDAGSLAGLAGHRVGVLRLVGMEELIAATAGAAQAYIDVQGASL